MITRIFKKIENRIKYRFVLFYIFQKLANIGIDVQFFYLHVADLHAFKYPDIKYPLGIIEAGYLSLSEIEDIYNHPESKSMDAEKNNDLKEKCLCFALKINGEIVSYSWFNLKRCHEVYPFPLKDDEAYGTGLFTFKAHRGLNLALLLKSAQYKELIKLGRKKIIGMTNVLNTPAIRFERKKGGSPINLIIYINMFKKYKWVKKIKSPRKFINLF